MGVSNGRLTWHTGACRSRDVGVRYVVIPCMSMRQNPGRVWRGWGRSILKSYVSTCSICSLSSGVSITDGIAFLLSTKESIGHAVRKEKLIVFIKIRKKSNGQESVWPLWRRLNNKFIAACIL